MVINVSNTSLKYSDYLNINLYPIIAYPRATSVVKNNVGKNTGLLLQKNFNFNKS